MPGDRKTEWGAARQAFLANVDEVTRRIHTGVPLKKIHAELGMPSVSYKRFCAFVQRFVRRENEEQSREWHETRTGQGAPAPRPAPPSAVPSSPSSHSSGPAPSPHVPTLSGIAGEPRHLGAGEPRPKRADIGLAEPGPSFVLDPDPVIDRAKKRDRYC